MNAELPPLKDGKHNSENASTIELISHSELSGRLGPESSDLAIELSLYN